MNINVIYFAYLNPKNWEGIVIEQLQSLKDVGLYDYATNIYMSVVSNNEELDKLKGILKKNYNKVKLFKTSTENQFEYLGIRTLYEVSDKDSLNLYFHSKGVVSGLKNKHNNKLRESLFNYTIKNYKEIITEFKSNPNLDLCAAIPHSNGFAYYNFFWVRGSYIKDCCVEPQPHINRFYWEEWVGNSYSNKKDIITFSTIFGYNKIKNKSEAIKVRDSYLLT